MEKLARCRMAKQNCGCFKCLTLAEWGWVVVVGLGVNLIFRGGQCIGGLRSSDDRCLRVYKKSKELSGRLGFHDEW